MSVYSCVCTRIARLNGCYSHSLLDPSDTASCPGMEERGSPAQECSPVWQEAPPQGLRDTSSQRQLCSSLRSTPNLFSLPPQPIQQGCGDVSHLQLRSSRHCPKQPDKALKQNLPSLHPGLLKATASLRPPSLHNTFPKHQTHQRKRRCRQLRAKQELRELWTWGHLSRQPHTRSRRGSP